MNIAMRDISRATALRFNLDHRELIGAAHRWEVSHPRQLAMALCRLHTARSLPEIGRYFGSRDHTTVLHAWRERGPESQWWEERVADRDAIMLLARKLAKIRQRQEQEWARRLVAGEAFLPPADLVPALAVPAPAPEPRRSRPALDYSARLFVPARSVVRGPRRPRALPSDLAPPSQAQLMGGRA